ncbi:4-alpha-glucanotransferase [Shewanella sp. JM162201]|uniref:4-alpha-glucanotransferase n=1 Tax=Shewanella jiangmenensis TaxID=2837387 RepID=A0ABS5UYP9_9GAMM|nr:4-alpha-glucanotransferase [Shewanella jiangmenensis]MBT1443271.1 4-alpha-glucanotransferase [Shewanella jiangmenensis]
MALDKLFYLQGVGDSFIDCDGARREFTYAERMALLCALMGRDLPPDEAGIAARIDALDAAPWLCVLPPLQHTCVDEPAIELQLPQALMLEAFMLKSCDEPKSKTNTKALTLTITASGDEVVSFSNGLFGFDSAANASAKARQFQTELCLTDAVQVGDYLRPDGLYLRLRFALPFSLDVGEYRADIHALWLEDLLLGSGGKGADSGKLHSQQSDKLLTVHSGELLIVPRRAYQGPLESHGHARARHWGLGVSLFYLRSQLQWGMGDFADLGKLIDLAADSGCDFITLTPLHAPSLASLSLISPYSPWDRRFLNPLYIAIDTMAEYPSLSAQFKAGDWLRERLLLNQLGQIDYPKVALLKYRALARLYQVFAAMDELCGRVQRFDAFVARRGAALEDFCQSQLDEAAQLQASSAGLLWAADSVLVSALGTKRFFAWLQFVADEQLEQSQLRCRQVGMRLGLVRDLAVGALGQGSEVSPPSQQTRTAAFCRTLDIGAPPDPFSAKGQNWGMPPFDPVALKQSAYQAFRQLCRENMRHCGALRIDHVMAMSRIWCWSPPLGSDSAQQVHPKQDSGAGDTRLGCYLHFPADTLLAILTLESHLSRCVLIGEDLGTVPPGLRGQLKQLGILGNDLVYFCRDGDEFTAPERHRRAALLQLGNQDVPPFIAWWRGSDLLTLDAIGLGRDGKAAERERQKQALVRALVASGSLAQDTCNPAHESTEFENTEPERAEPLPAMPDELAAFDALLHWCGSSRAELLGVSLWDLALETRPVNIPGTHNEYPNWRARLSLSLDSLWQSAEFRARLHGIRLGRRADVTKTQVTKTQTPMPNEAPKTQEPKTWFSPDGDEPPRS